VDLLEKYAAFARESTDAPTKYHRYCAASLVGTVLGRRVWFQHGHRKLFPHTWVALIGPSGVKKTTSLGIVEDLVADVAPQLVLPTKFSFEALYQALAEQPVGTLLYGELHTFLALLGRDFNAEAKSSLADWWDSPAAKTYTTKGMGKVTLTRPAVSILSASTLSWFAEIARNRDIAGGFFARMLFVVAEKSDVEPMVLPPARDESKANEIKLGLGQLLKRFPTEMTAEGRMSLTPEGENEYRRAFGALHEQYSGNDVLAPFATRGQVYVLKLAMISAAARRSSLEIAAEDVAYGYGMVLDALQDVAGIIEYEVADSKAEMQMNKLRKLIVTAGPQGITRAKLLKYGPVRRVDWLEPILRSLEAMEDIRKLPGQRSDSEIYVHVNGTPGPEVTRE
jgi:hypothetical protein